MVLYRQEYFDGVFFSFFFSCFCQFFYVNLGVDFPGDSVAKRIPTFYEYFQDMLAGGGFVFGMHCLVVYADLLVLCTSISTVYYRTGEIS